MIDYGTVSILIGTYNGEAYIERQLESIRSQTYYNWVLYISDDGSTDRTLDIVQAFASSFPAGKVNVITGPGKGFAANFLSLLRNSQINTPYYAFGDQDDIWLDDKLEVSVRCVNDLEAAGNEVVLYGGRTVLIDNNMNEIGFSSLFKRKLAFNNALIQSFSGGNTMLFNKGLKKLVEKLPAEVEIVSHDWFLYILCSAVGGFVYYDKVARVLYRQHAGNLVGSNNSLHSKLIRLKKLFDGDFKKWLARNEGFLSFYESEFTNHNKHILKQFRKCGSKSLFERLQGFITARLYRQYFIETTIFMLMSALNKLK